MNIYEKPVLFAIAAAAVVSVGTLVTTFVPLFMPSTQPVSPAIRPYSAIEIEGRDIYIREGCNNCHSQTVRPLRAEVARYGDYSRAEESAYDRPFLWGSRRTGPDLARVGGKYPDSWHYQHMDDPQGMFPKSNMPAYRWLGRAKLDASITARKAKVLGSPSAPDVVAAQLEAFKSRVTSADFPSAAARAAATPALLRGEVTELDALVAYLQKVGRDRKDAETTKAAPAAAAAAPPARNPFAGDKEAAEEGARIFRENCVACHGEKGQGGIGPNLAGKKKYGDADAALFATVSGGRPGGMPPFAGTLGTERVWKVIAHVRRLEQP